MLTLIIMCNFQHARSLVRLNIVKTFRSIKSAKNGTQVKIKTKIEIHFLVSVFLFHLIRTF